MTYLYLAMSMVFSATITIGGKLYNNKNRGLENVSKFYSMLVPVFSTLGWLVILLFDFSFDARVLPYSLMYGITYSCFTIGVFGALGAGSTSLTALVKQIALVGVSVWGFIFWDTPFTPISLVGIVLIVVSLMLCLLTKEEKADSANILKWLFFAALITFGNAGCSIVQRYQQMAFDYQHKNVFMFFGVFFSSIVCAIFALREKKTNWAIAFKTSWFGPALSGFSSAIANVFMLLMIKDDMSPVIMYPGMAVGGLMITTLISIFCFHEKLRPVQWCGLAIGAVALVLLNI